MLMATSDLLHIEVQVVHELPLILTHLASLKLFCAIVKHSGLVKSQTLKLRVEFGSRLMSSTPRVYFTHSFVNFSVGYTLEEYII